MVWTNPTDMLTQFRLQLVACASATSAGIVEANVHYPGASLETNGAATADPYPIAVIAELSTARQRYAVGAIPIMSGTLQVTIHDNGTDSSAMETLARNIVAELAAQTPGIPFSNFRVELSSNPMEGERATAEDAGATPPFSIQIQADYGLNT
jgi:hypothetical protein